MALGIGIIVYGTLMGRVGRELRYHRVEQGAAFVVLPLVIVAHAQVSTVSGSEAVFLVENRQQEQFTDERLLEILQTTPFESSQQTIELLREQVEAHRDGAEPNDDLTMLCVRVIK